MYFGAAKKLFEMPIGAVWYYILGGEQSHCGERKGFLNWEKIVRNNPIFIFPPMFINILLISLLFLKIFTFGDISTPTFE